MSLISLPNGSLPGDYVSWARLVAAPAGSAPVPYDVGAFVPQLPFIACDAARCMPIEDPAAAILDRADSVVSLVRFGLGLSDLLPGGMVCLDAASAAVLAAGFQHEAVVEVVESALRQQWAWSRSHRQYIGLSSNPPGLLTTTVNEKRGRVLGLHFDTWDQLPLQLRARSRYRVSVNVGAGDRYFLFMATTAADVASVLGITPDDARNATDLLRLAVRLDPERVVYRLKVPPLWGYIAQTDYVAHDGSTLGACTWDFSMHMLGDFRPRRDYFQAATFYRVQDR